MTTTTTTVPAHTVLVREAHEEPRRLTALVQHLLLAALAFVPVLSARPGVVTSDTKAYLYLDPARFLGQVTSMWYPTVALGTVTHQYVGYLFPMGPYYALSAAIGVPTWIAQRLWLGAILFGAGAGVLYLWRALPVSRAVPGAARAAGVASQMVAALAYMLSPYLLQYSGRISVILLPWAGLPWMVALTARALRSGRWREPALFALVVAAVSGINASSALYVIAGPVLWLVWSAAVTREATWRRAGAVLLRIGVLSLLVSAWWIAGLVVEAGFGVDVLRYTESVPATSSTSTTSEVLRGLGYWFFYGGGRLGPWTESAVLYTRWLWLVALSYLLPLLAFVAAVAVRWRDRGYFVALVVVGAVLSVGAYPYAHPTAVGGLLKAFMTGTTAGLAMRSTDRATPLVILGLAVLLGTGVGAVTGWAERSLGRGAWLVGIVAAGLVVANNPALFNGDAEVVGGLTLPASLPSYARAAIRHLNAIHRGTRVLAVPGDAFAAYTWGDPNDTPQPGLLTRPFVTREQQVMGSMATADTLYAMDSPVQTAIQNWSALAPMARLTSAGDVLVEYDQQSAHYGAPAADVLAHSLVHTPRGLVRPRVFGRPGQRVEKPTLDPEVLTLAPAGREPPPLVTYTVTDPRPIARAESDTGSLVVAGDGTGLETLAAQGLLDTKSAVYYAGTLDSRPGQLRRLVARGATLVVTDTNRKQGFRWNAIGANAGAIETAADHTHTPTDSPIDLFPRAPVGSHTLATFSGAAAVNASSYGNQVTYDPEDRAYNAIDGNLHTAWETGTFTPDVDGQWWQVRFARPVRADRVRLVQPLTGTRHRHITRVTLTFTGRSPVHARLGRASRRSSGQVVLFGRRRFRTLRITIDGTSKERGRPVGFAEVGVPGQHVSEIVQLPTDLLRAVGGASIRNRLVIAMTRWRVSPWSLRSDPQTTLSRSFTLPTGRTFTLSGTATLSPHVPDGEIDRLVGVAGGGVGASSSARLTGDLTTAGMVAGHSGGQGASSALGHAIWQSPFGGPNVDGAWIEYDTPSPVTVDHLTLDVVADRRHSVPSAVTVTAETAAGLHSTSRVVELPGILRSVTPGATVDVPLRFPALTGQRIRLTFSKVRKRRAPLAGGTRTDYLPLGIVAVHIPGVTVARVPTMLPAGCQDDLLRIDGRPVPVRVVGPTSVALSDGEVTLQPCGADAHGLHLSAGHHVVTTSLATTPFVVGRGRSLPFGALGGCAPGTCSGWNVDQLTLDSAPGGGPEPARRSTPGTTPSGTRSLPAPVPGRSPAVTSLSHGPTSEQLGVRGARSAFELVLGESVNPGWRAVARSPHGPVVTLGQPELVDGFANGWQVSSDDLRTLGSRFTVALTWSPQRDEWAGIVVSAFGVLLCLVLALALVLVPGWRRWGQWGQWRRWGRSWRSRRSGGSEGSGRMEAGSTGVHVVGIGARPSWVVASVTAAATGALAATITTPWLGVPIAVAVFAGLAVRQLRAVTAIVAAGLLAGAVATVVFGQVVHPAPEGGNWPRAYGDAAILASMAVAFLGADAVVDYGRRLAGRALGAAEAGGASGGATDFRDTAGARDATDVRDAAGARDAAGEGEKSASEGTVETALDLRAERPESEPERHPDSDPDREPDSNPDRDPDRDSDDA